MFESIFTATTDTTISATSAILSIGVALILGLIVSFAYMTSNDKKYSRDFAITLVFLPAIVAIVIMLIGSSTARALSMAGAFALVRFRSAPGTAKDIAIVFFVMAVGLAAGLGFITFAIVITLIISLVLIILSKSKFACGKENEKTLRITIPEDLNYNGAFDDLFAEFTTSSTLERIKTTNMGTLFELTYAVTLKEDINDKEFIDSLRCRNGNLNIVLSMVEKNTGIVL